MSSKKEMSKTPEFGDEENSIGPRNSYDHTEQEDRGRQIKNAQEIYGGSNYRRTISPYRTLQNVGPSEGVRPQSSSYPARSFDSQNYGIPSNTTSHANLLRYFDNPSAQSPQSGARHGSIGFSRRDSINPSSSTSLKSMTLKPSFGGANNNQYINRSPPSDLNVPISNQSPRSQAIKPKSVRRYASYYLPIISWVPRYKKSNISGDILAGISMASFQIPLCMSYATSLAKLPAVAGLFGMVFPPLCYAVFGSVPQMIIGPEVAISLILGQISVKEMQNPDRIYDPIQIAGVITSTAGVLLFLAGLFRYGFIDTLISRGLLRGFLCALGVIMIIGELVPELGLEKQFQTVPHVSIVDSIGFLIKFYPERNTLTSYISLVSFIALFGLKKLKIRLSRYYPSIVLFPEILLTVVISTVLSTGYEWNQKGVSIVGEIRVSEARVVFPLSKTAVPVFKEYFTTSIMVAILGFFESTTASKPLSLMNRTSISSNRELVALGISNFVGGCLCALPSFGAFGRSKINKLCGAKTQVSSVVMSCITFIAIMYLMPYFYYLPTCVLAVIVTVVGLSLFEEVPHDLQFFWKVRGYDEILMFTLSLVVTIFWSAVAGIAVGIGIAVIRTIKNSSRSRIHILGRIPGTNWFANADEIVERIAEEEEGDPFMMDTQETSDHCHPNCEVTTLGEERMAGESDTRSNHSNIPVHRSSLEIEEIEGCLIVKIPEPLVFPNSNDLQSRLRRLELYGSLNVHPSHPRIRDRDMTRFIIIDLKGMTEIDTSGIQTLCEIVKEYKERGSVVFFTRLSMESHIRQKFISSGLVDLVQQNGQPKIVTTSLGEGFYNSIEEALAVVDETDRHLRGYRSTSFS